MANARTLTATRVCSCHGKRVLGAAGLLVAVLAVGPALVRFDVTDERADLGAVPTTPLVSGGHDPR